MTAAMSEPLSEADLLARVARLEEMRNALAAEHAEAVLAFARAHAASRTASGTVEPEALERSIAAQVGLACRVSPHDGRRRVRIARDLHAGHDRVRALFAAGELSDYKVATIVAATAHLDPAERAQVDEELAERKVETLGVRRIHDLARSLAAAAAPDKFTRRCRAARSDRRVSIRRAADGMADLTAHLPVEQAVACYAALVKAADELAVRPEPLTRGRGQVIADTLVERVTGQALAGAVNVEVQIVVPVEALLDPTTQQPAEVPGHGPLPTDLVSDLLTTAAGRKAWRRLVTRDGIVIGGDSRQRSFTGFLASLLRARDGHRCREPFCDAPIRHIDHIRRWADGGSTTFDNGRGLCAFHNHVRETPEWSVEARNGSIVTTTPTGHFYTSDIRATTGRPSTPRNQPDAA